jgi:hypothetical protein
MYIHFILSGEFIVNILNAWLVPSWSEFNHLHISFICERRSVYASHYEQQNLCTKPLRSMVFERILRSLCLPYVSGYIHFNDTILTSPPFSSSKSTPPPYSYPILVHILRPHHNSHAMPPHARSYHPRLI